MEEKHSHLVQYPPDLRAIVMFPNSRVGERNLHLKHLAMHKLVHRHQFHHQQRRIPTEHLHSHQRVISQLFRLLINQT